MTMHSRFKQANAEVGGSSPPRPTTFLISAKPDNAVRRPHLAQVKSTWVRTLPAHHAGLLFGIDADS
jgi:hypothetical protein